MDQYNKYYGFINDVLVDSAINFRRPFERQFILKSLKLRKDDVLLEIGCNRGNFLRELARLAGIPSTKAFGVDLNADSIRFAKRRGGASFLVSDASNLPFRTSFFDKIVTLHTLEHVPNYKGMIAEALRVLKPGGTCVVTVPVDRYGRIIFWGISTRVGRVLGLDKMVLDRSKFHHQVISYVLNNPHLHIFRLKPLASVFEKAGFEVVQVLPCCYLPIIPLGKAYPQTLKSARRFDWTSYSYTYVLRKPIGRSVGKSSGKSSGKSRESSGGKSMSVGK